MVSINIYLNKTNFFLFHYFFFIPYPPLMIYFFPFSLHQGMSCPVHHLSFAFPVKPPVGTPRRGFIIKIMKGRGRVRRLQTEGGPLSQLWLGHPRTVMTETLVGIGV